MADPTPPIDPAGAHANFNPTPQTPVDRVAKNQSQSSPSSGDSPDLEALKKMLSEIGKSVPALKDLVDQVEKLSKKTDDITKSTGSFANKLKGMTSDYKYMVAGVDDVLGDVSDKFKQLAGYQRELGQHAVKNAKSYEEVLEVLEKMNEASEETLKRGLGSPEQLAAVRRHKETVAKAALEMKGHLGKAFDPDVVMELVSPVSKVTNQVNKLSEAMKKARLTNLQHDIRSTTKGMQALFGFKDRASKYHAIADTFHELKQAKEARRMGQMEKFHEHRQKILEGLPTSGLGLEHYRRSDGSLDRKRYLADAKLAAKEHGYTGLAGKAMAQSVLDEQTGVKSSMLTRVLAQGEGHLGKGVTSVALDALEGAGGALGGVVASGGLAIGIGELIKELIDKDQKQKAEVDEQIGGSGGYEGLYDDDDPNKHDKNRKRFTMGDRINVFRQNLNSYNPQLGIGYDKNFAIMKALNEGGFSTKNLSKPLNESEGILGGSFGALQQNVYEFGRAAGLNSDQTMTETLKLVAQYKQSLVTTEDFFIQITKDSRAAGISTMKYIGLLDEVNSHYERSNKLIMATVDTIRILGITGRNTVEDLSEQMATLTNSGKERTPGQQVFASQLVMNNPGLKAIEDAHRQQAVDEATDNLYKAFGHIDATTKKFTEGIDTGGVFGKPGEAITKEKIQSKAKQGPEAVGHAITEHFGKDDLGAKAANEASKNLLTAQDQNLKLNPKDADAALRRGYMNSDFTKQRITQFALVDQGMRDSQGKFKWSDFFDTDKRQKMLSDPVMKGVLGQAYGTEHVDRLPSDMRDMMTETAESYVKVGQLGLSDTQEGSEDREKLSQTLDNLSLRLQSDKDLGLTRKGSREERIEELKVALSYQSNRLSAVQHLTREDQNLGRDTVAGDPALIAALKLHGFDDPARKASDEAKNKVLNVTTLEDLFNSFFKDWMNKLLMFVTSIESMLSFSSRKQGYVSIWDQKRIDNAEKDKAALASDNKVSHDDFITNAKVIDQYEEMIKHQDKYSNDDKQKITSRYQTIHDVLNPAAQISAASGGSIDGTKMAQYDNFDGTFASLWGGSKQSAAPSQNVKNTYNSVNLALVDSGTGQTFKTPENESPSLTKGDVVFSQRP